MARPEIERWVEVAGELLEAARRLDSERMQSLAEERMGLQDRIARSQPSRWSDEERREAAEAAGRVRRIDERVRACGSIVLQAIGQALPGSAPSTYGRRGALRGY